MHYSIFEICIDVAFLFSYSIEFVFVGETCSYVEKYWELGFILPTFEVKWCRQQHLFF